MDEILNFKKTLAEKNLNDIHSLFFLSLYYRYQDEYDLELNIIEKALALYGTNSYMREREAWHKRSTFHYDLNLSKVVPRPNQSFVSEFNIRNEILEQLCFVSACNDKELYFEFLIELIESIRATELYKTVPFYVLDLGLNDEQKHILSGMVDGIVEANWDIPFNPMPPNHRKCIIARAFLENYFPNHDYYFWLDADSWVQGENAISAFLNMADNFGIAAGRDVHTPNFLSDGGVKREKFPPNLWNPSKFAQVPQVWASTVCYKKGHVNAQLWQNRMKQIAPYHHEEGGAFWVDQNALNLVFAEQDIAPLEAKYAHSIWDKNQVQAFIKEGFDSYTLFTPYFSEQAGIIGVHHKQRQDNQNTIYQLQKNGEIRLVKGSVCYRVWPWKDKPWLLDEMMKIEIK